MNNIFYEMIFRRKSFHIFRNVGNESISEDELYDIQNVYSEFAPLNPEIKTAIHIVPEKETNCKELNQGAPVILDYLCDECKTHFENVKKGLKELNIEYVIIFYYGYIIQQKTPFVNRVYAAQNTLFFTLF